MVVTVAACQICVDIDRPDPRVLERAVREAAARGARLVVLPELAVSGCCFASQAEAQAAAEPLYGPTVRLLRSLSSELGCVLVCGIGERAETGEVFNSAVLVEDGELRDCYRKAHLWDREPEFFSVGSQPPSVVDTRIGRIATMICYDLEFPEWVRLAAEAGADIVAAPCSWPLLDRPRDERPLEVVKAQAAAGTYRVHVVAADRCGQERGTDWIGGSVICDSTGYPLAGPATASQMQAAPIILTAELKPTAARDKSLGPRNDAFADRRPSLYGGST